MIEYLGFSALVISFIVTLYGIGAAYYGAQKNKLSWVESARKAMLLTFPLLSVAVGSLLYLMITNHFEFQYVYNVISRNMPLYLKITALWGGQSGSLLFWSWTMAAFASAVALRKWDRDRELLPWVTIVSLVTMAFFIGLSLFVENPFVRFWQGMDGSEIISVFRPKGGIIITPRDGYGLNPLLRHPGMILHPPALYLGFVSFVIPFAFAIASLITGRSDDRWIRITRRWTLVAWLFLSLGLVLGSLWAYDVLGWGGYWGWDPVEIAALMPWLTGTAFLHSVMLQEKRGQLKRWNMILIILTYSLVIIGTFLTRSGVLSSVHAFSQSAIGPLFFGFMSFTLIISLALVRLRWKDLESENQLGNSSLFSRESLFLLTNLLFIGILIVCFWGVFFPLISELFTGQKVTVGPPYYERAAGPLFGAIVFLIGVCPLTAWGYTSVKKLGKSIWKPAAAASIVLILVFLSGIRSVIALITIWVIALAGATILFEYSRDIWVHSRRLKKNFIITFWKMAGKNRRRYGGNIIHLGVVLMAVGIIGIEFFQTETQQTLSQGDVISLSGYELQYETLAIYDTEDGRNIARAVLNVSKDGQEIAELHPRLDYFYDSQQQMTVPGVRSTLEDDLYVILVGWDTVSTQKATFKVFHNPLVIWLWIGSIVFSLGSILAIWPVREKIK
ncbi:MAG: heme lyase CcmF/NrfE family subunit [Anaerolineaceae bacterium]|nr:heme lyase CcmF/NrfE family subunit [Anaerolineaceae bacterium]